MKHHIVLFVCFLLACFSVNAQDWKAGTIVDAETIDKSFVERSFVAEEISDELMYRMKDKSFAKGCTTSRESLRYLHVLHINKDGQTQRGEMVCNKQIAADLLDIFRRLYEANYVIERMVLVDDYDAIDERTMTANNTSCFNFRFVSGTKVVSKHGKGMAIDINPLYNPCYDTRNGKVEPLAGRKYATNRDKRKNTMMIDRSDLCYRLFVEHGFKWGGAWKNKKDYQHFEK